MISENAGAKSCIESEVKITHQFLMKSKREKQAFKKQADFFPRIHSIHYYHASFACFQKIPKFFILSWLEVRCWYSL